jgi:hypothetical protein
MTRQVQIPVLLSDLERAVPGVSAHVETVDDALGRKWASDAAARAAIERMQKEQQADLDSRQAYARWVDDLALRRKALAEKIRAEAGGSMTPASSAEARERVQAALQRFDERNPELDYYRWLDKR